MSQDFHKVGLLLEPLDVLFFRDGKPFGEGNRVASGLPLPQTLAGAVWTALLDRHGCDFQQLAAEARKPAGMAAAIDAACRKAPWIARVQVRGPWLARKPAQGELDVLVPVPAILHQRKQDTVVKPLHRLQPLKMPSLPGWEESVQETAQEGLRPLWLANRERTEAATGYLSRAGLDLFLQGGCPAPEHLAKAEDLFDFDNRTGIVIQPDRLTAKDGGIYGIRLLALKPQVGFYAEVWLPPEGSSSGWADNSTLSLGGESKRVRVEQQPQPYAWPGFDGRYGGKNKPLLLLTTPGLFATSWRSASLTNTLAAAAVPGSVAVSGWDMARRGPKRNRFAAQAGSVYFLDQPLSSWPDSLADEDDDRNAGWGCFLKGVWTDE